MPKLTRIGYAVIGIVCIGPLDIQIKNSPPALSGNVLGPKCLEFGTVLVGIGLRQGYVPDETRIYGAHPYCLWPFISAVSKIKRH